MNDPNNRTNIPLGLDMNDFMGGQNSGSQSRQQSQKSNLPKVPESNDPPIIDKIMKNAPNFRLLISTRIKNLTGVSDTWDNARNKIDTFEYLRDINDLGIINDVVNFAFNKTRIEYMDMRSKEIVFALPAIIQLCSCKYDMYFKNGILAAWKILNYLQGVIISSKQKQILNQGNIDIALEDKIKIYDEIIEYFHQIIELDNIKKHLDGKPVEGLDLVRFVSELTYFFKKCRGA